MEICLFDEYALLLKETGSSSSYHANIKDEQQQQSMKTKDEIFKKFPSFKQFDFVNDASDHHFIHKKCPLNQHPNNWSDAIQEDWEILEKDLPDSIFVRAYKSKMNLLRAVIIGPKGTPYQHGLFFFDFYFPSNYPIVPPVVYFHSRGVCPHLSLFASGQVYLSLLVTKDSIGSDLWRPHVSTILQVLVSIQGQILTEPIIKPPAAKSTSQICNKDVFTKSLSIMEQMIRRPPKNFEDFIVGHFINRAHDILEAYNAYMEEGNGAMHFESYLQRMVRMAATDQAVLEYYNTSLAERMKALVKEFTRIGVEDCEKFLYGGNMKRKQKNMASGNL
ncbi:probable ubiquitin-conjugating enzyme E2 25 [Medicago truncatula]|uniref:probable ubiquitin-conjugating enzyme E2 25 n=1 Tax=Medicago truncatula TaxID=3880 RepID=UPI000D2F36E4|nr:probable ubiquitin-conjugating enzyme E2 25 [Medicago truncatula]